VLRGGAAGTGKRPRALDNDERVALDAQRRKLNPAFHLATRELSEANAAALHIAGSSAGHAAAVQEGKGCSDSETDQGGVALVRGIDIPRVCSSTRAR
jgi:hypothetical protein